MLFYADPFREERIPRTVPSKRKAPGIFPCIAGFVCFFIVTFSSAQTPSDVMQLRKYKSAAMTLYYHLFKPAGYSNTGKYPLILAFHGVGEDGDSSNTDYINKNGLVSAWVKTAFQNKHPCFVVAPHNPSGSWTDTAWTVSNSAAVYRQGPISTRLNTAMQILDSLQREFSIDSNKIYVTGLSIGGWATWDLVTRFPARFAAAFPQSGGVDTSKAGVVAQVPIWCFHGQQDNVVAPLSDNLMMDNIDRLDGTKGVVYAWCHGTNCPAKLSAAKIDSLTNAGMIHFYSLDPTLAHAGWDQYYGDTLIQNWLMKQSKHSSTGVNAPRSLSCSHDNGILRIVAGMTENRFQTQEFSGCEAYDMRGKRISTAKGNAPGLCKIPGVVLFQRKN